MAGVCLCMPVCGPGRSTQAYYVHTHTHATRPTYEALAVLVNERERFFIFMARDSVSTLLIFSKQRDPRETQQRVPVPVGLQTKHTATYEQD